ERLVALGHEPVLADERRFASTRRRLLRALPARCYSGAEGRLRMIKSILVALDGSEHADAALQYALWLAARLRAAVLGLPVTAVVSIEGSFLHDISGSLGFEPYLDFSAKMREALRERGRVLLATI